MNSLIKYMTSKQRSNLRAIASKIDPVTQIGKSGINDALIDSLDKAIEKRELIKVTLLENSGLEVKETGFILAEKLKAEFVFSTGRKIVLYRLSKNDKIKHIEF